jgi:hypothetical protein
LVNSNAAAAIATNTVANHGATLFAGKTNLFGGSGTTGLVQSAGGDAGKYLAADGTWGTPAGTATSYNDTPLVNEAMLSDYRLCVLEDAAARNMSPIYRDAYTDMTGVQYNTNAYWCASAPWVQNYSTYVAPPANHRLAYYGFNSNATDSVSTSNGTWTGTASYPQPACDFSRLNMTYTNCASFSTNRTFSTYGTTLLDTSNAVSVSCWLKSDQPGGMLLHEYTPAAGQTYFGFAPNGTNLVAAVNGTEYTFPTAIPTGTWTAAGFTWTNGSPIIAYISGLSNGASAAISGAIAQASNLQSVVPYWSNHCTESSVQYDAPVAYYPLNSNLTDSVTGSNGTGTGAWTTDTYFGTHAGYFNGSTEAITVNPTLLQGKTEATISCWVRLKYWTAAAGMVFNRGPAIMGFLEGGDGTFAAVYSFSGGVQYLYTSTILATNSWYHIAGVGKSGEQIKIYINGSSNIQGGTPLTSSGTINQSEPFHLARDNYTPNYSKCDLDEVAIFDRALSSSEIRGLYMRSQNVFQGSVNALSIYSRPCTAAEMFNLQVASPPVDASITSVAVPLPAPITRARMWLRHNTYSGTLATNLQVSAGTYGSTLSNVNLAYWQNLAGSATDKIYTGDVSLASSTNFQYQARLLNTNVYHQLKNASFWLGN